MRSTCATPASLPVTSIASTPRSIPSPQASLLHQGEGFRTARPAYRGSMPGVISRDFFNQAVCLTSVRACRVCTGRNAEKQKQQLGYRCPGISSAGRPSLLLGCPHSCATVRRRIRAFDMGRKNLRPTRLQPERTLPPHPQTAGCTAQFLVWGSGAGLAWVANNSPKLSTD